MNNALRLIKNLDSTHSYQAPALPNRNPRLYPALPLLKPTLNSPRITLIISLPSSMLHLAHQSLFKVVLVTPHKFQAFSHFPLHQTALYQDFRVSYLLIPLFSRIDNDAICMAASPVSSWISKTYQRLREHLTISIFTLGLAG